ncbi:MAG TPA: septum formation initiator family protein [Patescibacteria group bacterium]|nr:septum formation initiator family protein [Patescibacteria group bacterium]
MEKKIVTFTNLYLKKWTGYGIWLIIGLLSLSTVRNIGKVASVRANIKNEQERLVKIEEENRRLEKQIEATQTTHFIEKEVRNKLGLVKTGEAVVVLPDEEMLRKLAPKIDDQTDSLPDPNWKKWEKLFF